MVKVKQQARRQNKRPRRGAPIVGLEETSPPTKRTTRQSASTPARPSHAAAGVSTEQAPEADERFRSNLYRELYYKTFSNRAICDGRHVDFESLGEAHAGFIHQWFKLQGWDKLLTEQHPIYPDLVRQFYTHFDHANKTKGVIYTWVKGKEIKLDESLLARILKIPRQGVHVVLPGKRWSTLEAFDPQKCLNLVLMDEDSGRHKKPEINDLPLPTRLLHLILFYTFNCRNGRLSSLTYLDMLVMYFILTGVKMNMPRMMIDYMVAAQKGTKKGLFLPYGMWLTKVFEHFGVDFSDEVVQSGPKTPFNKKTVSNALGYKYDVDEKKWVYKAVKCARVRERIDEEDDDDTGEVKGHGNLKAVMFESIVVQEMLKRIRPEIFTDDVMIEIQGIARSRMDDQGGDSDDGDDDDLDATSSGKTSAGGGEDPSGDDGPSGEPSSDDDDDDDSGMMNFNKC